MKIKTTDNQQEIFDVINENDEVIGQASRWQCHHDKNLIQRAIGVIVVDQNKKIFIQKRSQTKDKYASYWNLSAAGHVESGNSYEQTAVKELEEEVGIKVKIKDLIEIGKFLQRAKTETEMFKVFLVRNNGPFKLNKKEVELGQWIDLYEFGNKYKNKSYKVTPCTAGFLQNKKLVRKVKNLL